MRWERKPLLRAIYGSFYRTIGSYIRRDVPGPVVELGSGMANLKSALPECCCTDQFANPWIDWVQDAYALSLRDGSVSNLVLFDVLHHLEFPGSALREFERVLAPQGRLILFEPCMSLLGWLVYGVFHDEPIGWTRPIRWCRPASAPARYYSAQGNASRIFTSKTLEHRMGRWTRVALRRFSALSYVASGGFRGPQLYPTAFLPLLRGVDRLCDPWPSFFATRMLVVLENAGTPARASR